MATAAMMMLSSTQKWHQLYPEISEKCQKPKLTTKKEPRKLRKKLQRCENIDKIIYQYDDSGSKTPESNRILKLSSSLSLNESNLYSAYQFSSKLSSSLSSYSLFSTKFFTSFMSLKYNFIIHFKIQNSCTFSKQIFLYFCCLLGLITIKPVFGQNGHNGHCGDIKTCTAMFKNATMSNDLSYDLSRQKIEIMCVTLNRSVECLENYRKSCLKENSIHSNYFDQTTEGSLGLTIELCNNAKFKDNYLTHGPCQKRHLKEFDRCLGHDQNTNTVTNNNNSNKNNNSSNSTDLIRFIENCCALYNYHNCIYDISMDKCGRESADFSLKILEIFHRSSMRECAKHANLSLLCGRARYLTSSATSTLVGGGNRPKTRTNIENRRNQRRTTMIINENDETCGTIYRHYYQIIKLIGLILVPLMLINFYCNCFHLSQECLDNGRFAASIVVSNVKLSEQCLKRREIRSDIDSRQSIVSNDDGASFGQHLTTKRC